MEVQDGRVLRLVQPVGERNGMFADANGLDGCLHLRVADRS